jgi:predicted O-methyltransferase YrrM
VKNVLNGGMDSGAWPRIEDLRSQLLKNKTPIEVLDFGAGTSAGIKGQRTIADITRLSAKNKKMGRLLFRLVHYYQPRTILELGTSFGLSTAYLASANTSTQLITLEGAGAVARMAKKNFETLGLGNIEVLTGNFDENLPLVLRRLNGLDMVFLDGNHRKEPTLDYFKSLLEKVSPTSMIIVDDIHWSRDMEEAWKDIKADPRVMMTIDLFFMGLVFFRKAFKVKQDLTIRF